MEHKWILKAVVMLLKSPGYKVNPEIFSLFITVEICTLEMLNNKA